KEGGHWYLLRTSAPLFRLPVTPFFASAQADQKICCRSVACGGFSSLLGTEIASRMRLEQEFEMTTVQLDPIQNLHAATAAYGRSPEIPAQEDAYGWLVGSWDLEV